MKFDHPQSAKALAALLNMPIKGNEQAVVTGINEINRVEKGDIIFVDHPKYYDKALQSDAICIIINTEVDCPEGKALIISDDPFRDHNQVVKTHHRIQDEGSPTIGKGSIIHPSAQIHPSVVIGEHCIIDAGAVLRHDVTLGDRVIIQSNTVIGGEAFYYKKRASGHDRMLSCGSVVIEDDVEIGPCCTIDRGVSADTRIGAGTKIDCQVQIGHDTIVGKHCLMAAQVGISGACIIDDHVTLWGQVGVPSKIHIGEGAVVLGQSGLSSSHYEGGKTYLGSPAGERREKFKELAALKKLPEIIRKLDN